MKNIFNKVLIAISLIINTVCLALVLMDKYNSNKLVIISFYVLLFIPTILKKFKLEFSRLIETIYLLFTTLSVVVLWECFEFRQIIF